MHSDRGVRKSRPPPHLQPPSPHRPLRPRLRRRAAERVRSILSRTARSRPAPQRQRCAPACHGPNGNSANPEWPRLAGQSAVYIAEQLRLFKAGIANNPIMKPLASTLSDQDISDLAVYYQAQTVAGLEADPSSGKPAPTIPSRR